MKKIVIVSGIQISNNPRVVKEANILAAEGYEVEVIGAIFTAESNERIQSILSASSWRHIPVIDLSKNRVWARVDFIFARLRRKVSFFKKHYLNIESPSQLGYFARRLLRMAIHRNADLYIVHLESALWVGKELLKQGYRVAIDVEDWYSEDGLPKDKLLRPVRLMKNCESYLLKQAVYSTTTSHSLAKALKKTYQCSLPTVVYNSFPCSEREYTDGKIVDRKTLSIPSIIWFSQTIGPGRGLETLVKALNKIDLPFELHLRGTNNRGFVEVLLEMASPKTKNSISVHSQIPQSALLSRLMEHDIGYCGELSECQNHDLTISNKMMEYFRSGLAIVASDTSGHKEMKRMAPSAVHIFNQKKMDTLVSSLTKLLEDNATLVKAKKSSFDVFEKKLDWVNSSKVLNDLVNASLGVDYNQ